MKDLKVGMYVRTESGLIAKYIEINNEYEWHVFDNRIQWYYEYYRETIDFENWEEFINEKVVKASYNIIDLIEVGDYVNGERVTGFDLTYFNGTNRLEIPKRIGVVVGNDEMFKFSYHIKKEDIESIVTKEQFKNMEYRIV